MPDDAPLSESARGYLSDESKKRFTVVAGVLGAVFFVAQFLLPMLLVFLIFFPTMMMTQFTQADLRHAVIWHGEVWYVERADQLNFHDPAKSPPIVSIRHVRPTDLSEASDSVRLDLSPNESSPALLPAGDRLWVIGKDTAAFYESGSLKRFSVSGEPAHASEPFVYQGHPAVFTLGNPPVLSVLEIEGDKAEWQGRPLPLNLPPQGGAVREVEAVEAGGRQYLLAALSTEDPDVCTLSYRELEQGEWLTLIAEGFPCSGWMPLALGRQPAVVFLQPALNQSRAQFDLVTATPTGGQRQRLGDLGLGFGLSNWRALASGSGVLVLSEGMPGSLKLVEVREGKIARKMTKEGSFPFGPNMMAFMFVPQCLPIVLSLVLAFILTIEMRKHRVQNYVAHGVQRKFATLWQRAWAQVIDALVLGAGFIIAVARMWRLFSHPESMMEDGAAFPLALFGLMALAFLWVLLVLVAFSYLEGRYGKTPGKWLLRIRVLGTDLTPCGFWRALVRNLLTFVDGFFNFLVGVLLVALTENWQRLGDLAARTIVVVDETGAS